MILATVAAIFVLLAVVGAVFGKGSSSPSSSGSGGAAMPSLPSLLSTAPAPGFAIDPSAPLNGYLMEAQVEQEDGDTPLPARSLMYAASWTNGSHEEVMEEAVILPTSNDAEAFGAGEYNSLLNDGGQPFTLPGLTGDAGGLSLPVAASRRRPEGAVVVARSQIAMMFVAVAGDPTTAQTFASRAAQVTGASLAVDPGTPGVAPAAGTPTRNGGFITAYRLGELLGSLVLLGLVVAGFVLLVRRLADRVGRY
jgi:hypothetical protein